MARETKPAAAPVAPTPAVFLEAGVIDQAAVEAAAATGPDGVVEVTGPTAEDYVKKIAFLNGEVARLNSELGAQALAAVASSARVIEMEAEVASLKARLAPSSGARVTDGPLTLKDGPPPAETFKMVLVDGERHTDGRSSPPTVFEPYAVDNDDRRPHAYVTQTFGDHLVDVNPGKFVWAD